MFDIIFEILFDLLIEGSLEAAQSRRVPMPLRIVMLGILIAIYGGILYVIVSIAIEHKSAVAWIIAVLYVVFAGLFIRKKYQEYKSRRSRDTIQ